MKKTVLSLAFVLSISLAFGAETKPVVCEVSKSDYSLDAQTKTTNFFVVDVTVTHISSCGIINEMIYESMPSDADLLCDAETLDYISCGGTDPDCWDQEY
jgi:hypothetical protein